MEDPGSVCAKCSTSLGLPTFVDFEKSRRDVSRAAVQAMLSTLLNYRHLIIGLVGRFKCLRVLGFGGNFGHSDWSGKHLWSDLACLGEDAS